MDSSELGVVSCQKGPDDDVVKKNLRRKIDGVLTTKEKITTMMQEYVDVLNPPPPNVEKREAMYYSIRPYVPHEFQGDSLYAKPSEQEGLDAKAAKQARQAHRAAMAMTAKDNQDRRGREVGESAQAEAPAKKRKTAK